MKKILIANYTSNVIGGAEIAIANLIRELKNEKCNLEFIFLLNNKGALENYYNSIGLKTVVINVSNPRRKYPGLHTLTSLKLSRYLKKEKINLVLCNTFPAVYKVKTACKLSKTKFGVYLRDHPSNPKKYEKLLHKANFIFAVSQNLKEYYEKSTNLKIEKVNDWINVEEIIEKSKRKDIDFFFNSDGFIKVAQIGRIQSIKQQDLFLRSIPKIISKYKNFKFYIVGEANSKKDQEYLVSLKLIINELKLEQYVIFTGFIKNVEAFISNVDIVVLPSKNEAFPRTILECQSIGIPIIASHVGGCIEMIENKITGLLFDSLTNESYKVLANKVIELFENKELYFSIKENSKVYIKNNFLDNNPKNLFVKLIKENL